MAELRLNFEPPTLPVRRRWRILLCLGLSALALLAGIAAGQLAEGQGLLASGILGAALIVAIWVRPAITVPALLLLTTLIEQFRLGTTVASSDLTDGIPLFRSLSDGAGLAGVYITPLEILIAAILLVWIAQGVANHTIRLPHSRVAGAMGILLALAVVALLVGLARGANIRDSLWEIRPWAYLGISFLMASQLVKRWSTVEALIWVLIVGVGLKGVQGTYMVLSLQGNRPEYILAHEESFFFGIYLAITVLLWIWNERGWLRRLATLLAPFVLVADMANQRRTGWAILAGVFIVAMVLSYAGLPQRRKQIAILATVIVAVSAVYWIIFSHSNGFLGEPARAFTSIISPSARDLLSNQYRTIENINLGDAILGSTPLGTGFGIPIPQVVRNANITNIDSFISYVPHNGVLYVWMRLGFAGILAFWYLVAAVILAACMVVKGGGPKGVRLFAVICVCALVAYIVQGFYDMGLFWFRMAVTMGCLLGCFELALRLTREAEAAETAKAPAAGPAEPRAPRLPRPRAAVGPDGAPVPEPAATL